MIDIRDIKFFYERRMIAETTFTSGPEKHIEA